MLSIEERRMLYYFASSVYKGNGFIVDGGSFFGSSVCAMAQGLKDSPYFSKDHFSQAHGYEKPIIAYELGYLPSPKSSKIDKRRVFGGQEYILGESFVEILNKSILPYNDVVDLRIGDFNQTRWENSNIIELCFIDHAKTKHLNSHISSELYPSLSEGSILIHQDFFFDRLPWIKCTMGHFSENFDWIGQVFTSSIYRCIRPISKEQALYDPYLMATEEEKLRLHRRCHWDFLPKRRLFSLEISYAYLLGLCGKTAEALGHIDWVETEYPEISLSQKNARVDRLERARRQINTGKMNM